MPLYRAVYIRDHSARGMTFWASCPPMAADYAYTVLQSFIRAIGGGDVLTVSPTTKRKERKPCLSK